MAALLLTGCTMWIDHFVFFPDRQVGPPPAGVEERFFVTEDGQRLHAWYVPPRDAGPVLLWSHGNAGNIDSRRTLLPALAARGLGVLAYDYRGYGRSEGSPSERGVYLDATAAFDDLVARGTDPATIACFGESLGGAVSIEVATRRRCAAVIAVSTFTRLADVARRHYGPLGSLAGDRFDSLARMSRVSAPVLVAHGDRDEIIPFELGRAPVRGGAGAQALLPHPRRRPQRRAGPPRPARRDRRVRARGGGEAATRLTGAQSVTPARRPRTAGATLSVLSVEALSGAPLARAVGHRAGTGAVSVAVHAHHVSAPAHAPGRLPGVDIGVLALGHQVGRWQEPRTGRA